LFFDAPQRHNVARNPAGLAGDRELAALSASGPFSRTCAVFTGGADSCGAPSSLS